jgi:hypothetical protein
MTIKILQIIPSPPDLGDGIGDYASLLASQLWQDYQIETHFLVFRTDIKINSEASKFPVAQLSARNSQALFSAIPDQISTIILHFSGSIYFNSNFKGLLGINTPFWLSETLQTLVNLHQVKLILMIHELPMLNRGQFYFFGLLNPIQNIVSRRIASISDTVLTSSNNYQKIVSGWLRKPVKKELIFSNMGEPDSMPSLRERKKRLIVFGGSARCRIYQNSSDLLVRSCQILGIEEICDIGPSLDLSKFRFSDINLIELGFRSRTEISQLLLTAIAGCTDYTPFPGNLGKSGVFAAYCAHGLVPILTQYNPSEADGLYLHQHYLALDEEITNLGLEELQSIADSAHQWYQGHSLRAVSSIFAHHILG